MTRTRPSTPTRRWSWSITCWRSLRRPRRRRNSTWRSATAHHRSDPPRLCNAPLYSLLFPHLTRTMATLALTVVTPLSTKHHNPISHCGWGINWRLYEEFLFGRLEQAIMFTQPAKKVWVVRDTSTRPFPEVWSAYFLLCGKMHVEFLDNSITECFLPLPTLFFSPQVNVDGSVLTTQSQCHICTFLVRIQLAVFYWWKYYWTCKSTNCN